MHGNNGIEECQEIIEENPTTKSETFAQEVVKEAFGEELYTEHVKITLKNHSENFYPSQSATLSTFKKTYFGAKSQSMDENLIVKTEGKTQEGRTMLVFGHFYAILCGFFA